MAAKKDAAVMMAVEKQDSVELTRNAKGEYSWKVKLYFDSAGGYKPTLKLVDAINKDLTKRYGG